MKTIIGAIALTIAVPAFAQTAPAADPHAAMRMQGMDHSQHKQGKHDCKECCEKMKGKAARWSAWTRRARPSQLRPIQRPQGHSGH